MSHQPTAVAADDAGRILLVDDDATNLDVLRKTLDDQSHRLYVARSGEDAIKVARRARPLLILLDIVMPGIDGYETCRRLKEDPETRDAAVIFLSALTDPKDKVRGFEAGAVDFITKPFVGNEVIARVNAHLEIQRLLRRQAEARSADAPHDANEAATMGPLAVEEDGSAESVFRTGDLVAFRFRIVRYLARGGMGELYEAEDLELRERVALKTILPSITENERSIDLFKREVHLARQVTHPNVCRIYDVFRHRPPDARGSTREVVFLAMELLRGETLADKLAREGRLTTTAILPIARQMAAGLAAAHRVGVVHRDFKSPNVMLVEPAGPDEEVRAVVTDFGLARRSDRVEVTAFSLSLTDAGVISGTPAYMAPEQVEGGESTPATDVYAFGVVLYEMVTGVWPFVADSAIQTALKRMHEPPPSPRGHVPDLDPRWESTILRCLARQPVDRFASVLDVVSSLEGAAVETVPRRGPLLPRPVRTGAIVAAPILAIVAAGYAWYAAGGDAGNITSIAVLPFENATLDAEQEYLSDGVSEGLINRLSQLPGIKVVANSSSSQYKNKKPDPREVARTLDVTTILAGRLSQRGDGVSISVELINGPDGMLIWGDQYVRQVAALPQIPGDISRDVAGKLRLRLTEGDQQRIAKSGTVDPKAYELLLRGHSLRDRGGIEDRQKALDYFRQAIDADPNYALAYADLSDIYRSLINSGTLAPAEFLPVARSAAQKARDLDDSLADAHFALANLMTYTWEWTEAEREYTRAIELNPNLALAHRWYAAYLRLMKRHDQAIAEITRARELDPLSPGVNATVGFVLTSAGRYDEASESLKKTLELDRSYPYTHLFLGDVYAAQKKSAEAIAAYRQAVALGLDTPPTRISLGAAYARAGDLDRARTIQEELRSSSEHVSQSEMAILLAALGEREEALTSLEEAYRAHEPQLQRLAVDPGFDPLRADPRFQDLLQRVGLTP